MDKKFLTLLGVSIVFFLMALVLLQIVQDPEIPSARFEGSFIDNKYNTEINGGISIYKDKTARIFSDMHPVLNVALNDKFDIKKLREKNEIISFELWDINTDLHAFNCNYDSELNQVDCHEYNKKGIIGVFRYSYDL